MNLIDKQVMHKEFGLGTVVACSDSIIEINFSDTNKKFVFPNAFGTYLSLMDKEAAHSVAVIKEKTEEKRRQQELELEKERTLKRKKQKQLTLQKKFQNNLKISPRSQVVFWCEESELDTVFSQWKISTGVIKSGVNKGMPKRPSRLLQNSACILTTRNSDQPEKSRTIQGVYMVNKNFIGRLCEDGYVPAHSKYRFRLSPQESRNMLFWNYSVNKKYPQNMTWNTGRFRYFDNEWMAQILRDILSLKRETQEEKLVRQFYDYFCELNQIDQNTLPKPNGSLKRI